ncbi:MAG: tubulin-like doman-containing protein [Lachnospiraceae bacterium]|nr:tubulin-like doman-containing protein [Lachnospiraceae bacterium]
MILIDTQKEEFSKLKDIRIFGKEDDGEKFYKDLLVIGLGGVGGKVVASLKGRLLNEITPEDNISFLLIDSDIPAMEATIEDSKEGVGLNALEVMSIYRPNLENILVNGIRNNPVHPNLANWMPADFPELRIGQGGAEGNRQIGRLMFSNAYEDMRILLFERIEELYEKSSTGKLDVLLVTSVAGGTGSGILADVTYNIKALARVRKWSNFRVGACLLMPDVLFGNLKVRQDSEKVALLNANGCATLKEIDYFMHLTEKGEAYTFESTTHRLSMKDNIFDSCMLVSGKQDEQGYLPEESIYSDVANFLCKLASNKYIGTNDASGERKLLRDVFLENDQRGMYKVISSSDYAIPVREMENVCEHQVFKESFKRLYESPMKDKQINDDIEMLFGDLRRFLQGKAGDEINLSITGIIKMGQFERPAYKMIKKGQDNLRLFMRNSLSRFETDVAITVKSLKNRLRSFLDEFIEKCMKQYGPFAVIEIIGSAGTGQGDKDRNLIAEIQKLSELHASYQHGCEYTRIIESIKDMVSKRFFTFPAAKKETENGYYDACVRETLAKERSILIDEMDRQDVFGDLIRILRQKAESLEDIYAQFGEDLKNAVEDLNAAGSGRIKQILRNSLHHRYLPADYVTESKIDELKDGMIKLMVENEANIDNGRIVMVKPEMEKLYSNLLIGIGTYAPEKLLTVGYSDKKPTLQELNVMFVSSSNEKRDEIMNNVALDFVHAIKEGDKLCVLNDMYKGRATERKYISLPKASPNFSKAVKNILLSEPYNEPEESMTTNAGEFEISIDEIIVGVTLDMLECADDMQEAYSLVSSYKGLHIDEVTKDMRSYPNIK